MAAELASSDVSVNALWPQTMIYTDATAMFGLGQAGCRTSEIMPTRRMPSSRQDQGVTPGSS